jgi:2Fe-2S ferredoxin
MSFVIIPVVITLSNSLFLFPQPVNHLNEPEVKDEILVHIDVLDREDILHVIEVPPDIGLNVMEACKAAELPIEGTCGGMALCGSCHVYILSDHILHEQSPEEEEMLDKLHSTRDNSRLCCQIRVDERIQGLRIKLAPLQ